MYGKRICDSGQGLNVPDRVNLKNIRIPIWLLTIVSYYSYGSFIVKGFRNRRGSFSSITCSDIHVRLSVFHNKETH